MRRGGRFIQSERCGRARRAAANMARGDLVHKQTTHIGIKLKACRPSGQKQTGSVPQACSRAHLGCVRLMNN